jgi:NADPH-dependent curcumin reductase CurA
MEGGTVGEVIESRNPKFQVADILVGRGGWQHYTVIEPAAIGAYRKVDTTHVPMSHFLGAVGMPGVTAFYGLVKIIGPKAGETVTVSAASGAVGSAYGALAKARGCRVVGIAGGPEKCAWLESACGVDAAIDYKSAAGVGQQLDALCPEGIDLVFENVGGPVFDLILDRINDRARIALCGLISSYNGGVTQKASSLMQLVNKAAKMEGFLVRDYFDRYAEVIPLLESWVLDGSLTYQIDVLSGLDSIEEAMSRVFHGKNLGIQLVRLSDENATLDPLTKPLA